MFLIRSSSLLSSFRLVSVRGNVHDRLCHHRRAGHRGKHCVYDAVLGTIGYQRFADYGAFIGYGVGGKNDGQSAGCASRSTATKRAPATASWWRSTPPTAPQVHAFYDAAMKHGGSDEGPPGHRESYGAELVRGLSARPDRQQARDRLQQACSPDSAGGGRKRAPPCRRDTSIIAFAISCSPMMTRLAPCCLRCATSSSECARAMIASSALLARALCDDLPALERIGDCDQQARGRL